MIKVSVIVPSYNHQNYLEDRINSILNQSYSNYELIILDDCSSDDSKKVIEKYKSHNKVSAVIYNETNSGSTFKQWEKGISLSKGEYIWLAESDDYAENNFLNILVKKLEEDTQLGLAYSQSVKIDKDNNELGLLSEWTNDISSTKWDLDYKNNGIDECINCLLYKNTIPNASAVVFRKSVFQKIGSFDTEFKICGDWKLWFDMLMVSDVYFSNKPLNKFRFHVQNVRQSKQNLFEAEKSRIMDYFFDTLNKKRIPIPKGFRYNFLFSKLIAQTKFFDRLKNAIKIILRFDSIAFYLPVFIAKHFFSKLRSQS